MFMNTTDVLGTVMEASVVGLTGDIVTSLYMILFFLIAVCMIFQIPLEFIAVLLLPLCLAMASYYGNFMTPVILIIIYVSSLIAKHWLFR